MLILGIFIGVTLAGLGVASFLEHRNSVNNPRHIDPRDRVRNIPPPF